MVTQSSFIIAAYETVEKQRFSANTMVAYLPAASTMEMSFTSAQFSADLFSMANDVDFVDEDVYIPETVVIDVTKNTSGTYDAEFVIEGVDLTAEADEGNELIEYYTNEQKERLPLIMVNGLTIVAADNDKTTPTEAGTFEFKFTKAGTDTKVALQFAGEDMVDVHSVEVTYAKKEKVASIEIDNKQTAVGELILKYPVYSTGEETKAAGVKGYYIMDVYKVRCTAMPGFNSSYKSNASNQITFATMNPKNNKNGAVYKCIYKEI